MVVQRVPPASSTILDILERVLDRGIVIDAWVGVSVAGIRVLELDSQIVVTSLETYLSRSRDLERVAAARPAPRLAAARPGTRRGPRRRNVGVPPTAGTSQTRLRCENGCTFDWTKTASPPSSMICPYRPRVRCRLTAA